MLLICPDRFFVARFRRICYTGFTIIAEKEHTAMKASVLYEKDVAFTDLGGGVKRRILACTDELMIV